MNKMEATLTTPGSACHAGVASGRRFESVKGVHKRPAKRPCCCLSGVRQSLDRPSTCPQLLSPTVQWPCSRHLSKGTQPWRFDSVSYCEGIERYRDQTRPLDERP